MARYANKTIQNDCSGNGVIKMRCVPPGSMNSAGGMITPVHSNQVPTVDDTLPIISDQNQTVNNPVTTIAPWISVPCGRQSIIRKPTIPNLGGGFQLLGGASSSKVIATNTTANPIGTGVFI